MFASILIYITTGNVLNSSYVFTLATFFRLLQSATIFFPIGAAHFAEMSASIRRIQQYLANEDFLLVNSDNSKPNPTPDKKEKLDSNGKLELSEVGVKWPNSASDTLQGINLTVQPGELVTIIGASGSGKTTLLLAILQELNLNHGSLKVSGATSYASQEPWLYGETLRENILFGETYNEKKYNEVVNVCALDRDFELFQFGDGTLTRDTGSNLSGGQRARINLARAIYKDADIYLLDDPLSAVDNHVGKLIFKSCIQEYLKTKTVILVTHQIQYLKNLDNMYVLNNGFLKHFNSFSDLKEYVGEYFLDLDYEKFLEQDTDKNGNTVSNKPMKSTNVEGQVQLLNKETRGTGKVSGKVYVTYFLACGHWFKAFLMMFFFLIAQAVDSISEYYVSIW